ncbi:MAG TPA: L,D-transpeptidase [Xanthobacteraceae bacterium]|nr:L,D-transpeptidase [Xanthobacteraceae bacterium]
MSLRIGGGVAAILVLLSATAGSAGAQSAYPSPGDPYRGGAYDQSPYRAPPPEADDADLPDDWLDEYGQDSGLYGSRPAASARPRYRVEEEEAASPYPQRRVYHPGSYEARLDASPYPARTYGAPSGDAAFSDRAAPGIERRELRPPGEIDHGRGQDALASLPQNIDPRSGETQLPAHLRRRLVEYHTKEPAGTIIVDTPNTYLYLVLGNGKAIRYGIGVGREGFTWSGRERISRMAEWPDWHPPEEMLERQPYLPRFMAGGPGNPLGARALYLGNTLYRIHGTNDPSTIGTFVSSGCIRLLNEDIIDLYQRVTVGTRVVVLPGKPARSAAARTR